MNTTELLALFRDEVQDNVEPYLWPDAILYRYIDEAQKQFCRAALGIEDSRHHTIQVVPGVEWYPISPMILRLLGAMDSVTGRSIPIQTADEFEEQGGRFNGQTGGLVRCIIKGLSMGEVRLHPIPTDSATISLRVMRLPNDSNGSGMALEIDSRHHIALLNWVKFRAYSWQDGERVNMQKAMECRALFDEYCRESRIEIGRLRRNVAVVQYTGL